MLFLQNIKRLSSNSVPNGVLVPIGNHMNTVFHPHLPVSCSSTLLPEVPAKVCLLNSKSSTNPIPVHTPVPTAARRPQQGRSCSNSVRSSFGFDQRPDRNDSKTRCVLTQREGRRARWSSRSRAMRWQLPTRCKQTIEMQQKQDLQCSTATHTSGLSS